MVKPIRPGMRCRVVDSSRGISGTTIGRIVRVVSYADPLIHAVWGPMYECQPDDDKGDFETVITSPCLTKSEIKKMKAATFAGSWLEPLEGDPLPPKEETRIKELEH